MRWFGPMVGQDPAKGALPQLLAATSRQVRGGQYWGPDGPFELQGFPTLVKSSAKSYDEPVQKRLWGLLRNSPASPSPSECRWARSFIPSCGGLRACCHADPS